MAKQVSREEKEKDAVERGEDRQGNTCGTRRLGGVESVRGAAKGQIVARRIQKRQQRGAVTITV